MPLVTWDERAGVYRVTDTEDRLLLMLGTDNLVHSAVVFAAIAATKRWRPLARCEGYTAYPAERQLTGGAIYAVMANDFPVAIGLGSTGAAALLDLARIREAAR